MTDLTAYALHISIHALREEGDTAVSFPASCRDNFNPRPPRGGRRAVDAVVHLLVIISIHALREESDDGRAASGL